jgi:myosin-5
MYQKRYRALKSVTVKVQALYRHQKAIQVFYQMQQERAAITIQKHWRRYIHHRHYIHAKTVIYKLQRRM